LNKFNFESKLKNIEGTNILCGDEEYNHLIKKYKDNFEISSNKFKEVFSKFNDSLEKINKKLEREIDRKFNNLLKKKNGMVGLFKNNFNSLF
jgi:truncated hemoglobin YjbI